MKAQLDHLVVDVHDRLDEGAAKWRALGFHVTPRGRHSLGSANHLMIFGTDYLELLGWEAGAASRPDLGGFPVGLNGLVFRDWDHASTYAEMKRNGVPVLEPRSFHRPVELEDGSVAGDAKFTTTRLEGRTGFDGRTYFCQHDTPELVWRDDWRKHPNGVTEVARVVIAAADPAKPMAVLNAMFGTVQGNALPLAKAKVEAVTPASLGAALPEAGGRGDYLALIGFRVKSLAATEALLKANGVAFTKAGGTLSTAPSAAMNVALEFTE